MSQQQTDLLIIGGGYTGCSAALYAVEQGINTLLLEADTIGAGGSGKNMGMVNSGLWASNAYIESCLGELKGQALNHLLVQAPSAVFKLIDQYGIACEATQQGTLHCAQSDEHIERLKLEQQSLHTLGIEASLLQGAELAERIGSTYYRAALYHPHTGTINPMAYAKGLANMAEQRGVIIKERQPCRQLQYKNGYWYALTQQGLIKANRLLMVTNAYHQSIKGIASPAFISVNYFRFNTAPLDDNTLKKVLPKGLACWDIAAVGSAFRRDAAGRLILGANGYAKGLAGMVHRRWASRLLARVYPHLSQQKLENLCQGRVAVTASTVPEIVQYGPNALGIYGYSGRGIANATVLGQALAKALIEEDYGCLPLELNTSPSEINYFKQSILHELKSNIAHITC